MNVEGSCSFGNGLLFAGFNQDQSCFACGTENGFRIFNTDSLKLAEKQELDNHGIGQVEMLFRCNYVALIGGGRCPSYHRRRVTIWDDVKKKAVIQMDFVVDVRSVRLRRDRIVVVLENIINVYTFVEQPQQVHAVETAPNPKGLCCLCPNSENSLLAYPLKKRCGTVGIIDLANMDKAAVEIHAHNTALACLAMNLEGSRLATASQKGTLLRVFNTSDGSKLYEMRRGAQPAVIYSLNFSHDSSLLCASSNHGTVHIFALEDFNRNRQLNKRMAFLPKYFSSKWSFSRFELPHLGRSNLLVPCICAFGTDNQSVIVVCADGSYYKYKFDEKGRCERQVYAMFLEISD